jgi:excisionase family DNA binding protein
MHASEITPLALSPAEAAEVLRVTRQTVYNLIDRGQLRRFKVGRLTRIPTDDVLALIGGATDAA